MYFACRECQPEYPHMEWDDSNLYALFHCDQQDISAIVADHVPLYQQISGALKIIGRLKFYMGIDIPHMDRLADSCIKHHANGRFYEHGDDMCFPRNVAEMCIACLEQSDYRRDDLRQTLVSLAEFIRTYQQSDGGFSSSRCGKTDITWCGGRICGPASTPRSNISGAQGAIWAIGMIGNYLGWPDMPFTNPQGDWRDRVESLRYSISLGPDGKVQVAAKN